MRNKETGEVVEFKACMFNGNDCIVVYNDNQILRYNNVNEFRDKWEKTEEKKGEK